jgi:hypothetical protein
LDFQENNGSSPSCVTSPGSPTGFSSANPAPEIVAEPCIAKRAGHLRKAHGVRSIHFFDDRGKIAFEKFPCLWLHTVIDQREVQREQVLVLHVASKHQVICALRQFRLWKHAQCLKSWRAACQVWTWLGPASILIRPIP